MESLSFERNGNNGIKLWAAERMKNLNFATKQKSEQSKESKIGADWNLSLWAYKKSVRRWIKTEKLSPRNHGKFELFRRKKSWTKSVKNNGKLICMEKKQLYQNFVKLFVQFRSKTTNLNEWKMWDAERMKNLSSWRNKRRNSELLNVRKFEKKSWAVERMQNKS